MNLKTHAFASAVAIGALTAAISTGLLVSAMLLAPAPAHAQTTFYSAGFEASEGYSTTISGPISVYQGSDPTPLTTFNRVPGALFGQPSSNPFLYNFLNFGPATTSNPADAAQRAVNGVTVVNTAAATGAQSVQFNGTALGSQNLEYTTAQNLVAQPNGVLTMSADLRVSNPSANYGQWGLDLTRSDGQFLQTAAAFGFVGGSVLASNDGSTLFAAFNPNTGTAYTASYGVFNNYAVRLNYSTRTISGFFNNAQVAFLPIDAQGNIIGAPVADMPFAPATGNSIRFASFGQAIPNGTSENANFDNVRVTGVNVAAAPEPGTLALLGMGLIGSGAGGVWRWRKAS